MRSNTYRIEAENGWYSIVLQRRGRPVVRVELGLEALTLGQALGALQRRIDVAGWPAGGCELSDLNSGELRDLGHFELGTSAQAA